jgi:hypothetical protein
MPPVVVYKAHPGSVSAAVTRLRQAGLHPEVLDEPGPTVLYAAKGTYLVRIAVPAEEADAARELLAEMDAAAAPRVEALTRKLVRALVSGIVAAGVAAGAFRIGLGNWEEVPWAFVALVGGATFILVANRRQPGD